MYLLLVVIPMATSATSDTFQKFIKIMQYFNYMGHSTVLPMTTSATSATSEKICQKTYEIIEKITQKVSRRTYLGLYDQRSND